MPKSKLVIEMSVSEMMELRRLAGIVHQLVTFSPKLLKLLLKVKDIRQGTMDDCRFLLDELDSITPRARNILSDITSYDEGEAAGYRIPEGKDD